MWHHCWECSKCYRRSPENNVWGYACNAAKAQGFKNISIQYWVDSDPNRPAHWKEPFTPGPSSVFSTLCESCQDMTLEKYFQHLKDIHMRHDYRHHGGAGSHYTLTSRFERDDLFNSYYSCAVCKHEVMIGSSKYNELYKDYGFITVGAEENGSITVCSACRPRIKIKELSPLIKAWQIENKKMWKDLYPNSY